MKRYLNSISISYMYYLCYLLEKNRLKIIFLNYSNSRYTFLANSLVVQLNI